MKGLETGRTPLSTSHLPPAPREIAAATDVWVSLSFAVVLGISAAAIALWPTEDRAKTATPSVLTTAVSSKDPPSSSPPETGLPEVESAPTLFTNPFDASEVFEFPPGTTADAAQRSVAEMLLQRARDRGTQTVSVKHVRDHRSASLQPVPGSMIGDRQ
jgi:hypothetical protein